MNGATAAGTTRAMFPTVWAATVVAAISIAIYWSALGAGFVGDDFMILHRLRALSGPADAVRFFRSEFFEYYRPLGFISHAVDWAIAGQNARQFHLTNVLIHAFNAVIVLLIGRALSPRSASGPLAALLFALHPSNTEAVVWMSARFDLLATCFGLAAVCWMVRDWKGTPWLPALIFLPALLSKEAAVALPLAAAGWAVFVLGESTRATLIRVAPWVASLVGYSALRHLAGGVSAVGGSSRIPKLVALGVSLLRRSRVPIADGRDCGSG
jgi:protein O-mannosyl-transferase